MYCNTQRVFTVILNQVNASLINKSKLFAHNENKNKNLFNNSTSYVKVTSSAIFVVVYVRGGGGGE